MSGRPQTLVLEADQALRTIDVVPCQGHPSAEAMGLLADALARRQAKLAFTSDAIECLIFSYLDDLLDLGYSRVMIVGDLSISLHIR